MKPQVKTSEANVSRAIQELLDAKRIMWFRMNAGDRFGETNGRKWRIRGHKPGTADLLAIIQRGWCEGYRVMPSHMATLWIEVKAPGKVQRPNQIEFQDEVETYGMDYLLADSVDTVIDWLAKRNL